MKRIALLIALVAAAAGCASAETYFLRGVAEENRSNDAAAMEQYAQSIERDSSFVKAYNNRALILLRQNKAQEALAEINRAIQARDDYAIGFITRGNVYEALGQNDAALADYARAMELTPQMPEALFNRGNLLLKMRRSGEALAFLRQAHEALPDARDVSLARASAEKLAGDPATAMRIFRSLQQQEPGSELYARHIAETHMALKAYADAQSDYERLATRSGRVAYRYGAAVAAYSGGNLGAAAEHLKAVVEQKPEEARAHYLLALVHFKQERKAEAQASLENYMKHRREDDPDLARAEALLRFLKGETAGPAANP